jgi:tetratricopeptide (TPR) repeat protein
MKSLTSSVNKIAYSNNIKLSNELLGFFTLGSGSYSQQALTIIRAANNKHDILDKIISLCLDINAPQSYLILGKAYKLKGAKFRSYVIKYLCKFLEGPQFDKDDYHIKGISMEMETYETKLGEIYRMLGDAYEGEYEFEKALGCFQKACNLNPQLPSNYIKVADIYAKTNNLDLSIETLANARQSRYYIPIDWTSPVDGTVFHNDTFKIVIDSYIEIFKDKKFKGYIYKPRKRKTNP